MAYFVAPGFRVFPPLIESRGFPNRVRSDSNVVLERDGRRANSYRQMHEFIRIHRQLLNEAFGLELRYSPSYAGLWLILRGVNPAALETAFRRHASTVLRRPRQKG